MSKTLAALVAVVLMAVIGVPGHAQVNLLANPGFEDGLDHWTKVGTVGSINASSAVVRSGSFAAEFANVTIAYTGRGLRSDPVSVTGGETYAFGAYSYAVPTVNDASSYWRFVRVEWRDSGGNIISSTPASGTRFEAFAVWELDTLDATAPLGAVSATLLIQARRDSTAVTTANVYVDDAFIRGETTYTLTVEVVGSGAVEADGATYTEPITVGKGTTLTLKAVPNMGWVFSHWEDSSDVAIRPVTMTQDTTVTATFSSVHTITLSVIPSGSGTVTGAGQYTHGSEAAVVAVPNEGYLFDAWTENGSVVDTHPSYTFGVTGDRSLAARFILCGCQDCPTLARSWIEEPSSPMAGGIGQAVVGTDDAIYVLRASTTGVYQFWVYSPDDEIWSDLPVPPERPKNGTSLAWDRGNYLYALLGAASALEDADRTFFYRYEISSGVWTRLADTPGPQGSGNALTWSGFDNRLYAFLGSSYPAHGRMLARFDLGMGTWTELPFNLEWDGTSDGAALAWTGGEWLYALQGEWDEIEPMKRFARYHITTSTWQQLPDIPAPNGVGDGASLLWVGEWMPDMATCLFALSGGRTREAPGYDFHIYDMVNGVWDTPSGLRLPCPTGYGVGNRLAFAAGEIWYWQGAPTTWACGGNQLHSLREMGAHVITATATHGGTISPSGAVNVAHGGGQTFTITPDAGNWIVDVLVDGVSVGAVSEYVFTSVTADRTIQAAFRYLPECFSIGPLPVPAAGCVFWFDLPATAVAASLTVFSVDGVPLFQVALDPSSDRYPVAGRWEPRDDHGRLLGTGLYLCLVRVEHADGSTTSCPLVKMVIRR